jgi:hypothetical protein
MPDRQRDTVSSYLPPQFFKPGGVAGGVSNGVLDVAMAEIILNQASIRALVGEREAASMAEHVGMGKKGQGAASLYFRTARLTVDRCSGVRCSLTKKLLPVGFMRARCFSQAAIALSSSPHSGWMVESPRFKRVTYSTRPRAGPLLRARPLTSCPRLAMPGTAARGGGPRGASRRAG